MPDSTGHRPLNYGIRLSLRDSVEDCRKALEPLIKSDWEIFFTGMSWPSGEIKANLQFASEEDRAIACEQMRNGNTAIRLDDQDRRAPLFDLIESERREGVDRRLKSGERAKRPNTGRRERAGEGANPQSAIT